LLAVAAGGDGIEFRRRPGARHRLVRIVALTTYGKRGDTKRGWRAGAVALVTDGVRIQDKLGSAAAIRLVPFCGQ